MWGFGDITNQSDQILMFDYAVGPGGVTSGAALNSSGGNAILEIGSLGALYLTDVGHQAGGPRYWAVDVAYNDSTWRWFYDGYGSLDVGISSNGAFTLSGQGQELHGHLVGPPGPAEGLAAILDLTEADVVSNR